MFGTNWSTFVDARVYKSQIQQFFANSKADNSHGSGPIKSIIQLIQDLMVTYILTKFGADWFIFVDVKSVNKVSFSNFSKFKDK